MRKKKQLEEELRVSKNDAAESRQMEEDAIKSREAQRQELQMANRSLDKATGRAEVLSARVKELGGIFLPLSLFQPSCGAASD